MATGRLPKATLVEADCDSWPFEGRKLRPFVAADFDAYNYPYEAFRAFWRSAPKADHVALWFTDGQLQNLKRNGKFRHPDGTFVTFDRDDPEDEARRKFAYHNYFVRIVRPWIREVLEADGWVAESFAYYTRGGSMLYWGCVAVRVAGATKSGRASASAPSGPRRPLQARRGSGGAGAARSGFADPDVRAALLAAIAAGAKVSVAAAEVGFSAATVRRHAANDPEFREALDEALEGRGPIPATEKFDDDMKERFLTFMREGHSIRSAAVQVGVAKSTIFVHCEKYPDFADAVNEAPRDATDAIEVAVWTTAQSGNHEAQKTWLFNRAPDRWRDRRNIDFTNQGPTPHEAERDAEDWFAEMLSRDPSAGDLLEQIHAVASTDSEQASA